MFKRIKFFTQLYNLFHKKELEHNLPVYRKLKLDKKYFSTINSSLFGLPSAEDIPLLDREDSETILKDLPAYHTLSKDNQESIKYWSREGYAVLPGFFSGEQVEKINSVIEQLLNEKKLKWKYKNKLMFAIHKSDYLNSIGNDRQLLKILKLLLGKEVQLFQSINFYKGSQQRTHSDSIHMTTYPQGYLIAVWIALEEMDETNGPLHYYPGSHKLPYIMNPDFKNEGNALLLGKYSYTDYENKIAEVIEEKKLKKKKFIAKKGDILIWHANLLHGGETQLDLSRTRKSMVLHYFAKDVIAYHEITQRPALFKKQ